MMIRKIEILIVMILMAMMAEAQPCDQRIADSLEWAAIEATIHDANRSEWDVSCNTLRVVVHVVYDSGTPLLNSMISPGQVHSQIRFTNMVLRNDSLGYNAANYPLGYTLELASVDPDGNPTTGITYTDGAAVWGANWSQYGLKNTNAGATTSASDLAQELRWNADVNGKKYLNCYVVSKIDGHTGGGVQAYAWLPTSSIVYGNYNLYNTFGCIDLREADDPWFPLKSYTNKGYTFTHELGHNLGLYHVFQGQSCTETDCTYQGDRVCDTPPQATGAGCYGSCGFLSENIMDYINQSCKNRFTQGQVDRMNLVIDNTLQDYLVCAPCERSADLNGDGMVNIIDLSLMNWSYGSTLGDSNYEADYDLNCDGVVNMADVSLINGAYGGVVVDDNELKPRLIYDITGKRVSGDLRPGIYIEVVNGKAVKRLIIAQ